MTMKKEDYGFFTTIPRNLLVPNVQEGTKNRNISLFEKYENNEKLLLLLDYILKYKNLYNFTCTTLEEIIIDNGFKPSTKKGESNEQFRNALLILKEEGCITFDSEKIRPKEFLKITSTVDLTNGFIQLYDYERDTIMAREGKENNYKIFLLYCYLKGRCWRRADGGELTRDGGRQQICFPSLECINRDLGLTKSAIAEYIKILEMELDLITTEKPRSYVYKNDKKHEHIKNSSNVYLMNIYCNFNETDIRHELKEYLSDYYEKYEGEDRTFVNEKKSISDSKNHKFNSTIGGLRSANKKGTITEDGKKKLIKMEIIKNGAEEECYKDVRDWRKESNEDDDTITQPQNRDDIPQNRETHPFGDGCKYTPADKFNDDDNELPLSNERDKSFHYTDTSNEECLDFAMTNRKKKLAEEKKIIEARNECKMSELF